MMSTWWVLWMAFMFIFLVTPVGYGWGYRGWGPPYPQYVQRRRHAVQASGISGPVTFDHKAWGVAGDIMWLVMLVGVAWVIVACLRTVR